MPWLTMHQDLLECMLLQIILEASINTNINTKWLPEKPRRRRETDGGETEGDRGRGDRGRQRGDEGRWWGDGGRWREMEEEGGRGR
jgi:hypothetical protein